MAEWCIVRILRDSRQVVDVIGPFAFKEKADKLAHDIGSRSPGEDFVVHELMKPPVPVRSS